MIEEAKLHRSISQCRSLLFMPADQEKFVRSAHKRGAHAVILDLEDSVPSSKKVSARQVLKRHIDILATDSLNCVVRVNRDLPNMVEDLKAAITKNTSAVMIPKVMGAQHLQLIDETITQLETERGLTVGKIKLIGLIETLSGLAQVRDIASATSRLCGIALGSEDLSLDGGFKPNAENLFGPAQQMVFAARENNISAWGFVGSIAEFDDIESFSIKQQQAKAMGFSGALVIHPKQVSAVNQAYRPSESEIEEAKAIITVFNAATESNSGVIQLDNKMIDAPVVERARAVLANASY